MSGRGRRNKGILGEREVRNLLVDAGWDVRGLESEGDHLALRLRDGVPMMLHVETKRQETLRPDAWSRQAEAEAPLGTVPVVAYRRSHEPWRVLLRLDEFLALLK